MWFPIHAWSALALILGIITSHGYAAGLPENRADIMYHRYDGGGVEVQGPALLVRKDYKKKTSFSLNYYHDSISGASPDVFIAGASEYSESRDEVGAGVDYVFDNTLMSVAYSFSDENDFTANTVSTHVSHEVFGGLTTLDMGFARGFDTIEQVGNPLFKEDADRFNYQLGLSQVLTPTLLLGVNYEGIADKGFLNNPYRKALLLGEPIDERYPRTRTRHAIGVRAMKYWLQRASSYIDYRFYTDTWDITGHTLELGYSQYFGSKWLADFYYRYYTQGAASFYSNNFDQEFNIMARDKELSSFSSNALGAKVSYQIFNKYKRFNTGTFHFAMEYLNFDYDDYTKGNPVTHPQSSHYSFGAYTLEVLFSVFY